MKEYTITYKRKDNGQEEDVPIRTNKNKTFNEIFRDFEVWTGVFRNHENRNDITKIIIKEI